MQTSEPVAEMSPVGIYGWRKRCLYALLLGLLVVVICNLVATILLANIIHFNLDGLGGLSIYRGGVTLKDQSYVLGPLVTSQLSSRRGQPLSIETFYNMSMVVRNDDGLPHQMLHFWSATTEPNRQEVVASASKLVISDLGDRALFMAEPDQVTVGADILRVLEGGVHFAGSVRTPMLRSNLGTELMLESATRRLLVSAAAGVSIESRAADISASCLSNLQLTSHEGKVRLRSPSIHIMKMEMFNAQEMLSLGPRHLLQKHAGPPRSYQMCICTNGKLFVAHPEGECSVDGDNSQCR